MSYPNGRGVSLSASPRSLAGGRWPRVGGLEKLRHRLQSAFAWRGDGAAAFRMASPIYPRMWTRKPPSDTSSRLPDTLFC